MFWVHKENLTAPDCQHSRSGRIIGIAADPECAKVIVAIETGSGDLVSLRLTPMQFLNLKFSMYEAIELNKKSQIGIEACLAEIEGDDRHTQWSAD